MKRASLLVMLLAGGCSAVGPDYRPATPEALAVPPAFAGRASADAPQDLVHWWERFDDPILSQLVREAGGANLDLAVAESRLVQARESLVQARAGFSPSASASAGAGGNGNSDGDSQASFNVGADASWQADLFGRITRSVEAAGADAESAYFNREAVRVAITAEVASNYIQARQAQVRLAYARESLRFADDNLQIATWRRQAGLVSSLDVEQARSQRAQTAASIPGLENDFNAASFRLAVLTGRAPGAVTPMLVSAQPIPTGPVDIATGIPADTLRQRPDVRASERNLASATARIGIAEAQLYPSLRLSGNIGTSAFSLGGLFDAVTGSVLSSFSQLLFDGGQARSQIRSQRAAAEGAFATYRQSVLIALEDVERALSALTAARRRLASFTEALDAAQNTAVLARSQYQSGLTDFRTLLDAERSLVSARDGVATSRAGEALALVQLYQALGGGWDPSLAPDIQANTAR